MIYLKNISAFIAHHPRRRLDKYEPDDSKEDDDDR